MKTTYILFRDRKPKNNNEIIDLLIHFCREHNLECKVSHKATDRIINIEGEEYLVNLEMVRDGIGAVYWQISCLHKSRVCILKKMA